MKIDLPSGAWADLLAPEHLKAKHQRAVMRAITAQEQREGGFAVDLTDGVIAILVQDWNVTVEHKDPESGEVTVTDLPVPSQDLAVIEELTIEDYETLLGHPFVTQVATRLMKLRAERVSPDDWADPASPSEPSNGSAPGSRAQKSPRTATSAPSGTRTSSTSGSRSGGAGRRK